ncbi:hypothetical protein GTV32_18390 [Gordonia sp. SID5947]|uniref:hypothetical protein n=1 Tax=Gordonia sp. SID5947 TaxID=2690315 RepID=UPI00136CC3D2|nr:hypothetical protein [Gordonia sp. SID5947]MYR08145.1 hypothetical protein [Gordonia sp. SID5947]
MVGRRWLILAALVLTAAVTAVWARADAAPSRQAVPAPRWIVVSGSVPGLVDAGLPQSILDDANNPSTLLLVQHVYTNSYLPEGTPTFNFRGAADLARALRAGEIPDSMHWVLLDLEASSLTPERDQRDPIGALRRAQDVAHRYGKSVIFTPAIDLMNVLEPGLSGDALYRAFIDRLVTPGAAIADGFEIQSQRTEATEYATSFVKAAVQAAYAANPAGAPVLAGVSTNPNGRQVTADDMLEVYNAAKAAGATGYWLNIPGGGDECPNCGEPQYEVAVEFLKKITSTPTPPTETGFPTETGLPTGLIPTGPVIPTSGPFGS